MIATVYSICVSGDILEAKVTIACDGKSALTKIGLEEIQFDMVYSIKNLLHKFPIKYELWNVKEHPDEGIMLEELDELDQANVLVYVIARNHLESILPDQLVINWDYIFLGKYLKYTNTFVSTGWHGIRPLADRESLQKWRIQC